jgi:hypothetical protein
LKFLRLIEPKQNTSVNLNFRLGYCGRDEEVKALTLEAIGAAPARMNIRSDGESFWLLFAEKSD